MRDQLIWPEVDQLFLCSFLCVTDPMGQVNCWVVQKEEGPRSRIWDGHPYGSRKEGDWSRGGVRSEG